MGEGEYFGYMSMVLGERCTASTKTLSYCDLLVFKVDDFNRIKTEFPEFNDVLKRVSGERTEKMTEFIMEGIVL